jgi:hypothetical protein
MKESTTKMHYNTITMLATKIMKELAIMKKHATKLH